MKEENSKNSNNQTQNAEQKEAKKVEKEVQIQQNYCFGHKEADDIFDCFLTNKMFAHRGLWNKETPENSIGAFKKAIENGYGIELDVQGIEDNTPVVFHDSKLSRMTGQDGYIQNLNAEELEKIKLLNSDEKIPTLKEVLNVVDGKTPLLIEVKSQQKIGELEKNILELLKNYKGEYVIQSFNPFTLKWFYENAPKIWRGQLSGFFKGEKLNIFKKEILKRLKVKKISHFDFVNYDINHIQSKFLKRLEVPLLTWTVQNQEQYIKAIQYADNVVFDSFIPKI